MKGFDYPNYPNEYTQASVFDKQPKSKTWFLFSFFKTQQQAASVTEMMDQLFQKVTLENGKTVFECLLCRIHLSRLQRIHSHLASAHDKGIEDFVVNRLVVSTPGPQNIHLTSRPNSKHRLAYDSVLITVKKFIVFIITIVLVF